MRYSPDHVDYSSSHTKEKDESFLKSGKLMQQSQSAVPPLIIDRSPSQSDGFSSFVNKKYGSKGLVTQAENI